MFSNLFNRKNCCFTIYIYIYSVICNIMYIFQNFTACERSSRTLKIFFDFLYQKSNILFYFLKIFMENIFFILFDVKHNILLNPYKNNQNSVSNTIKKYLLYTIYFTRNYRQSYPSLKNNVNTLFKLNI